MAMTTYKFEDHSLMPFMDPDLDVVYEEHGVRGTMINVNCTCSNYDAASYKSVAEFQDYIKTKLAMQIAKAMINEKLVSFTLVEDIASNATNYRARCFATPDDQVRLIKNLKHKR
jgi:hypothetical protein